jgi:hypothetical protein
MKNLVNERFGTSTRILLKELNTYSTKKNFVLWNILELLNTMKEFIKEKIESYTVKTDKNLEITVEVTIKEKDI